MEDKLKFLFVLLCFVVSLSYREYCIDKKDAALLRIAMFLTLIADLCLLILRIQAAGVFIFCAVQFVYNIRYGIKQRLKLLLFALAVVFLVSYFVFEKNLIVCLSAMYAVCFASSLYHAMRAFKLYPFPNNLLVLLGMALFAACDVNVAFYNNSALDNTNIFFLLIWIFYLPAQSLLSVSAKQFIQIPCQK